MFSPTGLRTPLVYVGILIVLKGMFDLMILVGLAALSRGHMGVMLFAFIIIGATWAWLRG